MSARQCNQFFSGAVLAICSMTAIAAVDWRPDYEGASYFPITPLVIGLLHGLPIAYVGHRPGHRWAVVLMTLAMLVVAFSFGSINFVLYDLTFIAAGAFIGWGISRAPDSAQTMITCLDEIRASASATDERSTTETVAKKEDNDQIAKQAAQFRYVNAREQFGENMALQLNTLEKCAAVIPEAALFLADAYLLEPALRANPAKAYKWFESAERMMGSCWDEGLDCAKRVAHEAMIRGVTTRSEILAMCERKSKEKAADTCFSRFLIDRYMASSNLELRKMAYYLATNYDAPLPEVALVLARIYASDRDCHLLSLALYRVADKALSNTERDQFEIWQKIMRPAARQVYDRHVQKLQNAGTVESLRSTLELLPAPALDSAANSVTHYTFP